MKNHEKVLKALANQRRLQIVKYLKEKKTATVGILAGHLKLSFKSTSKHLAILSGAGIVDKEQQILYMLYSISITAPALAKRVMDTL